MPEQAETIETEEQAGEDRSAAKPTPIQQRRLMSRWRLIAANLSEKAAHAKANGLTSGAPEDHTVARKGADLPAVTPTEQAEMARKPESTPTPSFTKPFEDDPTIPNADATLGTPEDLGEPKPMADLSDPDNFPEDVRAVIEAAP
jgi:hypothetical protein